MFHPLEDVRSKNTFLVALVIVFELSLPNIFFMRMFHPLEDVRSKNTFLVALAIVFELSLPNIFFMRMFHPLQAVRSKSTFLDALVIVFELIYLISFLCICFILCRLCAARTPFWMHS